MNNPLSGTDPTGYASETAEEKVAVTGSRIKRSASETTNTNGTITVGGSRVNSSFGVSSNNGASNSGSGGGGNVQAADINNEQTKAETKPTSTNQNESFLSAAEDGLNSALNSASETIKSSELYKDNEMLINFIVDEGVNVILRTGQTLGGGGQVLLGGGICFGSGGLACAGGALIAAKGGDNLYSGLSGKQSLSEEFLQKATGSKTTGTLINAGLDLGTAAIGLLRSTPKIHELGEPMRHFIRKDPFLNEAAFRQTVKPLLRLEAMTATSTVADTLMKAKQNQ
jgi:hypothetical protein